MTVTVLDLPPMRVAAVRHVGPYNQISRAFARLGELAGPARLFTPGCAMIGIYHNNPKVTPAAELRSAAGVVVAEDAALPAGLSEERTSGGRYAMAVHVGPYALLGPAWAHLTGEWLPQSGERMRNGESFEIYRNTPGGAPENELITELYIALE